MCCCLCLIYLIMVVFPNITATWRGVAPRGDDSSLATANLRRSKALCRSLRFPSRAAICTAWIFPMYEGTRSMNVCSSVFPECLPTNLLPSPLSTSVANCSMLPASSSLSISGSAVIVPSFKSASGSSSCSPTITCWSFPSAKPCARTS